MAEEQRQLLRLRRRITDLCVLVAHLRGRFHLQAPLREGAYPGMTWDRAAWHAEVAARLARELGIEIPTKDSGPADSTASRGAA